MRFKSVIITVAVATVLSAQEPKAPTGYTDTPTIPGSKWRVHDDARPRPPVITPGHVQYSRHAGQAALRCRRTF